MRQYQSKIENPINKEIIMYMNNDFQGNAAIYIEDGTSRDFSSYKAMPIGERNQTQFSSKKTFCVKIIFNLSIKLTKRNYSNHEKIIKDNQKG